jgi:hypothetical protein
MKNIPLQFLYNHLQIKTQLKANFIYFCFLDCILCVLSSVILKIKMEINFIEASVAVVDFKLLAPHRCGLRLKLYDNKLTIISKQKVTYEAISRNNVFMCGM